MKNVFVGKNAYGLTVDSGMKGYGYVYVVKFDSGLVKIGITKNPPRRIKTLETGSGYYAINIAITIPHRNFKLNESLALSYFERYRTIGEWFDIDFQEAVDFVSGLTFDTEEEEEYSNRINKEKEDNNNKLDLLKTMFIDILQGDYEYNIDKNSLLMEYFILINLINKFSDECRYELTFNSFSGIVNIIDDFLTNANAKDANIIRILYLTYLEKAQSHSKLFNMNLMEYQLSKVVSLIAEGIPCKQHTTYTGEEVPF